MSKLQVLHRIDSIYPLYSLDLPNKLVCFQPNDWWFSKCNQCPLMFRINCPLEKDSILQEIRWYQWENVVNSIGKKYLEKVLKETLTDMYDSVSAQLQSYIR